MSERSDVVVVGSGLAGRMAALSAASTGVSVLLITKAESTLRSATGLIDLLGYDARGNEPISDPYDAIQDLPASHPYSILGPERIRHGLEFFDRVTGDQYQGHHNGLNGVFATQLGTVKPTARYPSTFEAALLSVRTDVLYLGFDSLPGLDGEFMAATLRERVPYRVSGSNLDLLNSVAVEQPRLRLASALDTNESWPTSDPIRAELADAIGRHLDGNQRVGLPAVLGLESSDEVRRTLADALGVRVFEYPTDPPSIPGMRLANHLDEELRSKGVEIRSGSTVSGFDAFNGLLDAIQLEDGQRFAADQFVLATGGLVGGGLRGESDSIHEPIFDFPVRSPAGADERVAHDPLAAQPIAKAGVDVDSTFRPTNEDSPHFQNLRACGSVLGGFDFAAEHSGSGVAVTTGVEAGRRAAEAVGE